MVTLPPEQPAPSGPPAPKERPQLHRARAMAESFGVDPARYDSARPAYPDELVERIVARQTDLRVLDVGCGTGIAARQFQAAGCSVLGVEPDERMAEYARKQGIDVEVATFEAWDPVGRTFDVVTAAQCWHWVDPTLGTTKAAEALRPGGRLAIFGHVFEPPLPIAHAFAAAYRRVVPDSPFNTQGRRPLDVYQAAYATIADAVGSSDEFDHVERWRFDWTRSYERDQWLDLLPTTGGLTRLPADQKAEILREVGEAIDAEGGTFTMEYVTLAATASRR